MYKNYIILAHKNPEQILHLIKKLDDGESSFYIHIDKNFPLTPFETVLSNNSNTIFIKNREMGSWCDIAIVKATINSIKKIIEDKKEGYCILLSGQDYPIKSNTFINKYLEDNNDKNFIETFELPTYNWYQGGLNRINYHKFNLSNRRGHFIVCPTPFDKQFYTFQTLKDIIKLIYAKKFIYLYKLFTKRKHPEQIKPFGGSQWWCLSISVVKKIIHFIEKNPGFLEYHKYSLLPDEMFFQTILMHLDLPEITLTDSLTFVDWERENSIGAPTFSINDFDLLINQPKHKLFARKFDFEHDFEIIKKLDNLLK